MPKVSVIIPAYNQAQYLGEAIQSVLAQTYQDFELVVVDDGSSDNTREVVNNYSDLRIRYNYQENSGLSSARNTGIRLTSAPYLTFLDSDDLFLPDKLALLVEVLDKQPEFGFVAGQAIIIDEQGYKTGKIYNTPIPEHLPNFLLNNPLHVGSILLRRTWQEKVGYFDQTLIACEDWDYWIRLARLGCKLNYLSKPVSLYRIHESQMTRDPERMLNASLSMLDNIFKDPKLPNSWGVLKDQAYSKVYLRAAAQSYRAIKVDAAKSYLQTAITFYPKLMSENAEQLALHISGWANDPRTQDPIEFLESIYDNLPETLDVLHNRKRKDLAQIAARMAFLTFEKHDFKNARLNIWRTFRYEPKYLTNRGLISILIRSWTHSRVSNIP